LIINQRDATVAATVIQWLGTNVGYGFLTECLRRAGLVIIDKDELEVLRAREPRKDEPYTQGVNDQYYSVHTQQGYELVPGAWQCSMFNNQSDTVASELILEAVALTRGYYGEPPALGMVTFVDPRKVAGFFVRTPEGRELRWGYSFWKAGFKFCGWTQGGLYALQLKPEDMPSAAHLVSSQKSLLELVA